MAGEFGISSDEVIALLRQMDVPVRSHLSLLTDEQVARVRARWEREKRSRAEKQAAPTATTRRRRSGAAVPEPAPAPVVAGEGGGVRRRRRSEVTLTAVETDDVAEHAAAESEPTVTAAPTFEPLTTERPAEIDAASRTSEADVTTETAPPSVEREASTHAAASS